MTLVNDNTQIVINHPQKGTHLTIQERGQIQAYKEMGLSNRQIAKKLNRAPQTINNEVKRGWVKTIKQIQKKANGKEYRYYNEQYYAEVGQIRYASNKSQCGRKPIYWSFPEIVAKLDNLLLGKVDGIKYSPYATTQKLEEVIPTEFIPCERTIYTWIDKGIMQTKNVDLMSKTTRKNNHKSSKASIKRVLGRSINERPAYINSRSEIGHFEIDTVVGKKDSMDNVLMVLTDRLSRYTMIFRIKDKSSDSVNNKLEELKSSMGAKAFYQTFKSLTSDNGLEFSRLQEVHSNTYYATPYTPSERGSNENVIRMIRRFIHKSTAISSYTDDYIQFVEDVVNDYPRKLLGGYSAESVYLYNEVLSLTS